MSLFKVLRGSEANLPTQKTDGWAYFCTDTGSFWIDHLNSGNTLVRSKISANFADKLRYIKNGATVELDPSEIATHTELASKLSAQNPSAAGALTISNNWENGVASFYKSNDSTNDYGTVIRDQDADANALSVVISAKNKSVSITDGESYYDVLTTEDMATLQTSVDNKVDKVTGKGLSTNDLTNALKQNYDAAYNHSQAAHAPVGAQANIIESVKVNGTALTVTNKSVNVTVPTGALASKSKISESDLDSTLATKLNGMTDADELEAAISAEAQRVDTALAGKADTSHSHNDIYYTETEVNTKLDNKVDKVNGKGLSTNDYTTTEKSKLAGIAEGANKYVLPSATDSVVGGMKLYTSTGTNTAGTMTQKAITDALDGKSGTGHNHDSVYSKLTHTHTAADVGATTQTYVDNQIKEANKYTDTKVAALVDSAPDTLDTLNELAAALGDDPNFATTMATELGKKATTSALNTHAGSNIHITSAERTNWNAAKTHADSAHAPSNAERNIIVGIQKNGTDVSVNSSTRKVNITVPTKTSELTNNSDFATNASVTSAKNALQANIDTHTENKNNPHGVTAAQVGAAPVTHEHSATDITDGILPVSRGGTGNNAGYVRAGQKAGTAIGTKTTIEGTENTASGDYSHVEGSYSKAIGNSSHAEGKWTTSSGDWSHAEGNDTKTGGTSPASIGADAPASGLAAHAEGYGSVARAGYSHAEGNGTVADGVAAHSEGQSTKASGNYSHAEGLKTIASGVGSHAEGDLTEAIGDYSHAEGMNTNASSKYQHVQGQYNVIDANNKYAHIVGNGSSNYSRSNAHTLDWYGNSWFKGDVYVGGAGQDDASASKLISESDVLITVDDIDTICGSTISYANLNEEGF